ncbi:MAG: hypothetical protein CME10_06845 [Gemmatimonadetes bacterium]|nr:hypothetical protein [Gemmatimonadota bacterium]
MSQPVLLNDKQVQDYIVNGYTTIKTKLTAKVHQQIHHDIKTLYSKKGNPGNRILSEIPDLYKILKDPNVHGALSSLLGPDYIVHPHRHCHQNVSDSKGQNMHQDSYEDDQNVRHHRTRWAMAFYYPQDTNLDMGPTSILPASQYYTTSLEAHKKKELPLCGQAGTVTIVHYDLWHRAMPNNSKNDRFMVKFLFTRMSEPHQPSWDHHDPTWDTNTRNSPEAVCIRVWDWMRGEKNTEITHQNSLQELKHKLLSDSEKERLEAVYHMGDSGEHSLPILIDALKSQATNHFEENIEKPHTNPSQLDTVVGFSSVGAIGIPYLIKLLSNDYWWLRAAAADILGDMGEEASESAPFLTDLLNDSSPWVQRNAIEALGNIGISSTETTLRLSAALNAPESWVRHNAALTLAKIGQEAQEAIPYLEKCVEDDGSYAASNAEIALNRIVI